jgi:UDP-N-acetylglucosamine--N-acetylmuramyl-(pentapeptide) pyrophosphoryl-undecaprenol N-acetylglucosamine transferase
MLALPAKPLVAIACGGTGGHLFPGLAVAEQLQARGCDVLALISPKEVDQKAVRAASGVAIEVLPAVGLSGRKYFAFLQGFWKSYRLAQGLFAKRPPQAVLAMGGFTSAPPVHAGRKFGAATFLHESNTIPGRANRWLARFVHQAFVGFPSAAGRLRHPRVQHTGTPVRPQFQPLDPEAARAALGLKRGLNVLLVMGGSQGASGINRLVTQTLPLLKDRLPTWQYLHLTGDLDFAAVESAYREHGLPAVVRCFQAEMELALGAATVAISRAGGSSQAELAAMRLPSILLPYPTAADNHQYFNARAFADAGAARLLEQKIASPETLWPLLEELALDPAARARMSDAVYRWHKPQAAAQIAESMLTLMRNLHGATSGRKTGSSMTGTETVMA